MPIKNCGKWHSWLVGRGLKTWLRSSLPLTNDMLFMNFMTSKHLSVFLAIKRLFGPWIFWELNETTHESILFFTFIQSVLKHSFSIPTYYLLDAMTSLMLLLRSLSSLSFNFNNMFCILVIFPFTTFWNNFPLSVAFWSFVNEVYNNPVFDPSSLWVSSSVS